VAPADASDREVGTFNATVFAQGLHGVGTAGGVEAAAVADPRAEDEPVGCYGAGEDVGERGHAWILDRALIRSDWS